MEGREHEVDGAAGPGRAAVEIHLELSGDVDVICSRLESASVGQERIGERNEGRRAGGSQRHAVRLWRRDESGIEAPPPPAPDLGRDLPARRPRFLRLPIPYASPPPLHTPATCHPPAPPHPPRPDPLPPPSL